MILLIRFWKSYFQQMMFMIFLFVIKVVKIIFWFFLFPNIQTCSIILRFICNHCFLNLIYFRLLGDHASFLFWHPALEVLRYSNCIISPHAVFEYPVWDNQVATHCFILGNEENWEVCNNIWGVIGMGMGQIFRFQSLCALTLKMEGENVKLWQSCQCFSRKM